ncbi:hypothetical protein C7S13_6038 [Burkholderia cepacia]|nr:hypothetical protein [Burkholderia cepacia]
MRFGGLYYFRPLFLYLINDFILGSDINYSIINHPAITIQ